MVGLSGFEPLTSRLSGVRSDQLSYRPLERETGLEPATPSLEGWCSSQLSYSRMVRRVGVEPTRHKGTRS